MANIKRANTSGITKTGTAISDVPDAPTIGAVTDPGTDGYASVAFTAATTGGAVTTFTATSTPGSLTATSATSPITITGLTLDTSYTFTVSGTNSTATGPASAASSAFTPEMHASYFAISTVTVPSAPAANVTFSSIPSTYKHLQIRMVGRCNRAVELSDAVLMRFNSDTASNYSYHGLYGDGSAAASYGAATQTFATIMNCPATAAGGGYGVAVCDILDYANANKNKTVKSLTGFDRNGGGEVHLLSSNWRNTNAITSISLTPANGSWIQYTSVTLYGIKG